MLSVAAPLALPRVDQATPKRTRPFRRVRLPGIGMSYIQGDADIAASARTITGDPQKATIV